MVSQPIQPPHIRFAEYEGTHAWQHILKDENYGDDLAAAHLTVSEADVLTVNDFSFQVIEKSQKEKVREVSAFIKRHEYLGTDYVYTTNRYGLYLDVPKKPKVLSAVVTFGSPQKHGLYLGEEHKESERQLCRRASISYAPKNLGSFFISKCIRHLIYNSDYRVFTSFATEEANEIGQIYSAANFFYVGTQSSPGGLYEYLDPDEPEKGWRTSRAFRQRSSYLKYAKQLGIEVKPEWFEVYQEENRSKRINWNNVYWRDEERIKKAASEKIKSCAMRRVKPKHRFVYVGGRGRVETKVLRKLFLNRNEVFPYPKRGYS